MVYMVPGTFSRLASPISMRKSVAELSPGIPSEYDDLREVFELVWNAFASDCVAYHVGADDIVMGIPPLSIVRHVCC